MLTPQEVQERTFEKAVFGGYDMGEVDDFLDLLSEDYANLYKENAVLKNKMKVLVRAVEEYREKEQSINSAIQNAQRNAETIIAQAKAAASAGEGVKPEKTLMADAGEIAAQQERLRAVKKSVQDYVASARERLRQEDALLEAMSAQEPAAPAPAVAVPKAQPVQIAEEEPDEPTVKFKNTAGDDVAEEIERNISRTFKEEEAVEEREPKKPKFEFIELQFGKDYEL